MSLVIFLSIDSSANPELFKDWIGLTVQSFHWYDDQAYIFSDWAVWVLLNLSYVVAPPPKVLHSVNLFSSFMLILPTDYDSIFFACWFPVSPWPSECECILSLTWTCKLIPFLSPPLSPSFSLFFFIFFISFFSFSFAECLSMCRLLARCADWIYFRGVHVPPGPRSGYATDSKGGREHSLKIGDVDVL